MPCVSAKRRQVSIMPQMNMTPLIDVTFQLILFFMLVNNIVAEESVWMILAKLDNPQVQQLGDVDRVVVNVVPRSDEDARRVDPLDCLGEVQFIRIGLEQYGPDELDQVTESLKHARLGNPEIEVMLRSDAAIYYEAISPVMKAIEQAGIHTVHLVSQLGMEDQSQ